MVNIDNVGLYSIKIDFGEMETYITNNQLIYSENDYGTCKLHAELVKNNEIIDLTSTLVRIKILTSSGATLENDVTIVDKLKGIVEYTFPDNALYEGINYFQIILKKNDLMKVSPKLTYKIMDVIDDTGIKAEANYPILVQLIKEVTDMQTGMTLIQDAEDKRVVEFTGIKSDYKIIQEEFKLLKQQNDTNIKELTDARKDNKNKVYGQIGDRITAIENDNDKVHALVNGALKDYENETHVTLDHRLEKYEKEIVDARVDYDGTNNTKLKDRLDKIQYQHTIDFEALEG